MKLHHVGIACKDIQKQIGKIQKTHNIISQSPVIFDENQDANLCILTLEDGSNLELVSGNAVASVLKKGMSYYHICYETRDIDAEITRLQANGALLVSPPKPAKLFDMRLVSFLLVPYGLIELLQI